MIVQLNQIIQNSQHIYTDTPTLNSVKNNLNSMPAYELQLYNLVASSSSISSLVSLLTDVSVNVVKRK